MNNVWVALITGITTGGISCFAVQGGLLASSLTRQKEGEQKKAVLVFLVAKIVAYTVLGFLLGLLGSSLIISPIIQGYMQILAGVFMLVTVGKILDLHPFFRKLTITPPKSIFRILRRKSVDEGLFSSGILGGLTVLIPCGVTQAMILLSVSSGNAVWGSLIMFAFILGTSPVFFALGLTSEKILQTKSLKLIAALAIFYLGIISINTGQVLRGSVHNLQNYYLAAVGKLDRGQYNSDQIAKQLPNGGQEAEISVSTYGYKTNTKTLRVGVPTTLKLTTQNTNGCSRAFTVPEYGISKILPESGVETITFTPKKTGRLAFTCSMGMYTGSFNVIE